MIVILLGQIDLSVPWVVAVGGMMATAATGWGPLGEAIAIPFGVACGILLGLVNGAGVALLRLPSMVVTLAVNAVAQGLMVVHTGGFSPQASSSPAMRFLATGDTLLGIPNALVVWAVVGAAAVFLLTRTTFGRTVYAIGNSRAASLARCTGAVVIAALSRSPAVCRRSAACCSRGHVQARRAQAMVTSTLLRRFQRRSFSGGAPILGVEAIISIVAGVILITLRSRSFPDADRGSSAGT